MTASSRAMYSGNASTGTAASSTNACACTGSRALIASPSPALRMSHTSRISAPTRHRVITPPGPIARCRSSSFEASSASLSP